MKINLPDKSTIENFIWYMDNAAIKAKEITLVHWINLAVVAVFVVLTCTSGYFSYSAAKSAEKANNAVQNGIYDKDGWSMIPGALMNEYTTYMQNPDDYARYKQKHPERAHY